jgi:hypothetical protein
MNWSRVVESLRTTRDDAAGEADLANEEEARKLLMTVAAIFGGLAEAIEAGQEPEESK